MAQRGIHKGASALLWGEPRFVRRGGNPPAAAFPFGETGKGESLPCCRRRMRGGTLSSTGCCPAAEHNAVRAAADWLSPWPPIHNASVSQRHLGCGPVRCHRAAARSGWSSAATRAVPPSAGSASLGPPRPPCSHSLPGAVRHGSGYLADKASYRAADAHLPGWPALRQNAGSTAGETRLPGTG